VSGSDTPLHPALARPILLGGAERPFVAGELALVLWLVGQGGLRWASLLLAVVIVVFLHPFLRKAAALDPLLSQVLLHHLRYQSFYPARPHHGASTPPIRRRWPH
jgi:type IV secretory pathway TrbD component